MSTAGAMLTGPVSQRRSARACDTLIQSANEAPSGRVVTEANQKAKTGLKPANLSPSAAIVTKTLTMATASQ